MVENQVVEAITKNGSAAPATDGITAISAVAMPIAASLRRGGARAPRSTTGTGSESTTICVLDVLALHVKTGTSHPALRPTLGVVDPDLTLTQPAEAPRRAGNPG